jgi:hypothetical protein
LARASLFPDAIQSQAKPMIVAKTQKQTRKFLLELPFSFDESKE